MTQALWFASVGEGLVCLGLLSLLLHTAPVRRLLALNILGNGVFLVFVGLARRAAGPPDPVPHAMVLTGLVVAVSATALGLVLIERAARLARARSKEPVP